MQVVMRKAAVVLEDGTVFPGTTVGAPGVAAGEACFTTANTGYEEAATDPSYVAQVLCFAYPLVGNYGVDPARAESDRVLRCAVGDAPVEELHALALAQPPIDGRPLDRHTWTDEPYFVGSGPLLALVDLGCKRSIPRRLAETGVEVAVVPGDWDADAILELAPRAVGKE